MVIIEAGIQAKIDQMLVPARAFPAFTLDYSVVKILCMGSCLPV
jgi:hypothetical protein